MKVIPALLVSLSLCASGAALAQSHDDHHDNGAPNSQAAKSKSHGKSHGKSAHHNTPPRKGQRLAAGARGQRVSDYGRHGLKAPPKGHEWRKVDNDYVLIAVATGLVSSVIAASN